MPMASCPSSTSRPYVLSQTARSTLDITGRHVGPLREERPQDADREPARREEHREDDDQRGRVPGPLGAEPFGEPEHAEARQHRADPEHHPVLRDHRERLAEHRAQRDDDHAGRDRARDRRRQRRPSGRSEGDDDERDLGALEQHGLVGDRGADPVPFRLAQALRPELSELALVDELFVVQRDDAGEPEDRLAQPAHAEQQQERPDDALQEMLRHDRHQRDTQERNDDGERHHRAERPKQRRAPATGHADGEDDGRRLDELDGAGDEGGRRGDRETGEIHARASRPTQRCYRYQILHETYVTAQEADGRARGLGRPASFALTLGARPSPVPRACWANTRASNSSSIWRQRRTQPSASRRFGAPNQSRWRTCSSQFTIFSYSARTSSASSYVKFLRKVSNSISFWKLTSQFSTISS